MRLKGSNVDCTGNNLQVSSANNLPFGCQRSVQNCLQLITKLACNLQNDIGEYCITMATE